MGTASIIILASGSMLLMGVALGFFMGIKVGIDMSQRVQNNEPMVTPVENGSRRKRTIRKA